MSNKRNSTHGDGLPDRIRRKLNSLEVAHELAQSASVNHNVIAYTPKRGWYKRDATGSAANPDLGLWHKADEALEIRRWVGDVLRTKRDADTVEKGIRATTVVSEMEPYCHYQGVWDDDPLVCGLPNGRVLELTFGGSRPADKSDYISRRLAVVPTKGECPHWERLIDHIAHDDIERTWIRRYLGYCLTGLTREGKFLFLQGDANGGKTTFIETLKSIFGDADRGYGGGVNGENLTSLRGDHKEWLARIDGMRMVIVSDIPNGSWNLGSLKATVTGDTITARFMNKESFEFRPVAKIIVSGNNKPRIPQSDSGFNRRLVLIPVDEIPEGERDKTFQRKLHMELPQIAHWMVDAAVEYFGKGLNESVPDRWSQASSSYQRDEDVIRQWFDSSCVIDEKAFTTSDSLVRSYNEFTGSKLQRITPIAEWLNQNCKHAYPGQADFNDPQNNRRRQKRGFYGIQLRPSSI